MYREFIVVVLMSTCLGFSTASDKTCGDRVVKGIVVDRNGQGFRTVQSAIDSVPKDNSQWTKIKVKRGIYVEKVTIPRDKQCIILEGEGQGLTKITYNAHEATDTSSTFTSFPSYTVIRYITFQNTYNRINIRRMRPEDANSQIKPAVAVRVEGDKTAFFDCGFIGLQDTLWDVKGKHFFKNCHIEGAIDFIFGDGQSVYEDCKINVTAGELSSELAYGYITAQGRNGYRDPSGFVFTRGSVTGNLKAYLGRAYGLFSRVVFINTHFGSIIIPQGWDAWNHRGHEWSFTYAEVGCEGSGSDMSRRIPWIEKFKTSSAKKLFSKASFINRDHWLQNIPY